MDTEDRLAGIVIAGEDARTRLAMAFSALIGYRSQNLWFLADTETRVLHPTMMPQAVDKVEAMLWRAVCVNQTDIGSKQRKSNWQDGRN